SCVTSASNWPPACSAVMAAPVCLRLRRCNWSAAASRPVARVAAAAAAVPAVALAAAAAAAARRTISSARTCPTSYRTIRCTAVMGGINVDTEGNTINRTPGLSRLPLLGELFKRRTVRRDTDEILFFITPRIIHDNGLIGPRAPQRSSVEGQPNPNAPQRAAAPTTNPPAATAAANTKAGQ